MCMEGQLRQVVDDVGVAPCRPVPEGGRPDSAIHANASPALYAPPFHSVWRRPRSDGGPVLVGALC